MNSRWETNEVERLKAALEEYRETLHFVNHEFKNSLTVISGIAKRLIRQEEDSERRNHLKIIAEQTDHLESICEDFLVMSRFEADMLEPDKEPIEDFFEDVIRPEINGVKERYADTFPGCETNLENMPPVRIVGDRTLLRTVFRNLLGNAMKYGDGRRPIELIAEETDDSFRFSVWNSGPPIPEDKTEEIFEKFRRVSESAEQKPRGTGLGLYNARRIIEAHGGDIRCRPGDKEGTAFVFTLPKG